MQVLCQNNMKLIFIIFNILIFSPDINYSNLWISNPKEWINLCFFIISLSFSVFVFSFNDSLLFRVSEVKVLLRTIKFLTREARFLA